MNKQELIDKYNTKKANLRPYCPNRNRKEEQLKSTIYTNIIDDLKQLDEPQKPVVPKFVAEWFEEHKSDLNYSIWKYIRDWEQQDETSDFYHWFDAFDKSIETLFRMKDGYEVEKEPLYYVYFPEIIASPEMFFPDIEGAYLMKSEDGIELADNNRFDDMKFTEREIKAIDERYWAFAVPVEEVAEG